MYSPRGSTSDDGAPGPGVCLNALATASAFSSPDTRKTTFAPAFSTGSVSVIRGTSGAIPGCCTPATFASRIPSSGLFGNSDAQCASGPTPSRIRSNCGTMSGPNTAASSFAYSALPSSGPRSPCIRCAARGSIFDNSASLAILKFECSCSGPTQRSSLNQISVRDQSAPSSTTRAYAFFGVEPPVMTMCPPRSAASAISFAASSVNWSETRTSGRMCASLSAYGNDKRRRLGTAAQRGLAVSAPVPLLAPLGGALERAGRGQHAALAGLRQLRQPRRLVDRIADHRVLEALRMTHVAGHHHAGRHTDRRLQLRQIAAHALVDLTRRAKCTAGGIVHVVGSAEHAQRTVALELVDPPAVAMSHVDHDLEVAVQQLEDLVRVALRRQGRRPDQVHEQHSGLALLASQFGSPLERRIRNMRADVATEQIAQLLALAQPGDHRVEAGLHHTELGPVVDPNVRVEVAALNVADCLAHAAQRLRE